MPKKLTPEQKVKKPKKVYKKKFVIEKQLSPTFKKLMVKYKCATPDEYRVIRNKNAKLRRRKRNPMVVKTSNSLNTNKK